MEMDRVELLQSKTRDGTWYGAKYEAKTNTSDIVPVRYKLHFKLHSTVGPDQDPYEYQIGKSDQDLFSIILRLYDQIINPIVDKI